MYIYIFSIKWLCQNQNPVVLMNLEKKSLNMIIKTRKVEGTKFNLHATLLVRDRKKSLYCICILYLCNSLTLVVEFSVQLYKGGSIWDHVFKVAFALAWLKVSLFQRNFCYPRILPKNERIASVPQKPVVKVIYFYFLIV